MKIHARFALVLAAAILVVGCGKSPTSASPRAPAALVAQHVDNPGQTPMKD